MSAGLAISGLSVEYRTRRGRMRVLDDVELAIAPGETLALVGESGSGKSTLAYAIMRYLPRNGAIVAGKIALGADDLVAADAALLGALRGKRIGMVYQDPATALNPALRLGDQLIEVIERHTDATATAARQRALQLLEMVRLPDPAFIMARFPHEVSGGEKQRVLIAMAFACEPPLLLFDEPTTALDATTAAGILDLIRVLQARTRAAILFISHDLGTVARVANRVAVIYGGRIVETGPVEDVLRRPQHMYTRMLLASVPNPTRVAERKRLASFAGFAPDLHEPPAGCAFAPRCPLAEPACGEARPPLRPSGSQLSACRRSAEVGAWRGAALAPGDSSAAPEDRGALLAVRELSVDYARESLIARLLGRAPERVSAVSAVSLELRRGEILGLVGESGCGKSSLARALVGLLPFRGEVRLGERVFADARAMDAAYRRQVQIVFQHPDQSLNPRMRVGDIVARPMILYEGRDARAARAGVEAMLERVRLPRSYARRFPHELSGGEKQRVAIARAFVARPLLVICDEVTSGLDVSVQASILNLLVELQRECGSAILMISHDLNLVQHFADRIAVMYLGRRVELRPVNGLATPPLHPYSEALLSSVPLPDIALEARAIRLTGPLPSPKNPPAGCRFHTRCPLVRAECAATPPPEIDAGGEHRILCHLGLAELAAAPPLWRPRDEARATSIQGGTSP
jgi:peptide/nickel transport system ATP-binding protein